MNRLKISDPKWAGFSSVIGGVQFVNGVSVDPVPRIIADRISAAIAMVAIDDNGDEVCLAGVNQRLVADAAMRAPVIEPLKRQTEDEARKEQADLIRRGEKAPVDRFFTHVELEKLADEKGIKGLREIGDVWGVKNRSIPLLIGEILNAQNAFITARNDRLAKINGAAPVVPEGESEPDKVVTYEPIKVVDGQIVGAPPADPVVEDGAVAAVQIDVGKIVGASTPALAPIEGIEASEKIEPEQIDIVGLTVVTASIGEISVATADPAALHVASQPAAEPVAAVTLDTPPSE